MASSGRHHEEHNESIVDNAVEVELELETVVDDGHVQGQQVVLVGDVGPRVLVLGGPPVRLGREVEDGGEAHRGEEGEARQADQDGARGGCRVGRNQRQPSAGADFLVLCSGLLSSGVLRFHGCNFYSGRRLD